MASPRPRAPASSLGSTVAACRTVATSCAASASPSSPWRSSAARCGCSSPCSATTTTAPAAPTRRRRPPAKRPRSRRRRGRRRPPPRRRRRQAAAVVETTEAPEATEPATTAPQEETEPTEPTDSAPASTGETGDTVTESSPPGTVVYDLSSEPTCTIGQTLRQGSAGPQVQCLQERLNEVTVGGTTLPEDGFYGEQTAAAVRAFQEANELTRRRNRRPDDGRSARHLAGVTPARCRCTRS